MKHWSQKHLPPEGKHSMRVVGTLVVLGNVAGKQSLVREHEGPLCLTWMTSLCKTKLESGLGDKVARFANRSGKDVEL